MNSERPKQSAAKRKTARPKDARPAHETNAKLPERLDELERIAQTEFVPRLEAIVRAMLEESSTIQVKRGASPGYEGEVLIEMVFGKKEGAQGSWTASLVTLELDPFRNEICIQAGQNLHMNRTIGFGAKDWEGKLIDALEWLLSDSMRPSLRISR
jgi:hypothetical protein